MKRILTTALTLALASLAIAQNDDDWSKKVREAQQNSVQEYEAFRQQALKDYDDFRRKANEEYAAFMEQAWTLFNPQPAEEIPWKPKPPRPVVFEPVPEPTPEPAPEPTPQPEQPEQPKQPDSRPSYSPIEFDMLPSQPIPVRPQPVDPIVYKPNPTEQIDIISFFGSNLPFHFDKSRSLHLADASEKSVADLWRQLSDAYYDNVIAECLQNRKDRNLCDWAYIMLTNQVAENLCGGHNNESVVMQMYLLTQSGFQMRLGRTGNQLFVLVGSTEKIYHYKYFMIDGVRYYNFDRSTEDMPFSIFNHAFPKESTLSLMMYQPKLAVDFTNQRTITSKRYPSLSVTVETNKNLIDFFDSCPLSAQWNFYSTASLSKELKDDLYPALRKAIEGKNQRDAANILINFVQTGFAYATDQDQFGYERPLYPDESFYYPSNDCEDRAILYSCLIRELLGLDVVLLNYPEHLATAVHFTDDVNGDFLDINGKKYIICDPTYIGAEIGRCMPDFKTVRPKIQML